MIATVENIREKLGEMMARFPEFLEAHNKFNCDTLGAFKSAVAIDNLLAGKDVFSALFESPVGQKRRLDKVEPV